MQGKDENTSVCGSFKKMKFSAELHEMKKQWQVKFTQRTKARWSIGLARIPGQCEDATCSRKVAMQLGL